ncbi:hypothetical protein ILUMI_05184 [Ignelater luminosus]|uniref:Probable proline--tRNA ligase, mitochondrial n=1 Tax=Ignelater luminosus TaxID=2038154 RepID=A0A8K0DI69_IGNLU|nr:hypothetical protein ILUMI_05184 [Ignelater luminosus]
MWQQTFRVPNLSTSSNIIHRLSKIFQPKHVIPVNAQIKNKEITSKSQRLMLELGIIRQASPGSFHFLPLGLRALEKLIRLVDLEMSRIGAQKVMFPTLTNAKLWESTGRLDDIGPELFRLKDRHQHTYILSPTHEEAAAELLASISQISYKDLPLRLYQTTSKYRDEMKPRFGLMRGRQFMMKDLYTFDTDLETAQETYNEVCESYDNIFKKIGINFVKALGTCGAMGGSLSHEYHYRTDIGEDQLLRCLDCGYSANVQHSGNEKCGNCGNSNNLQINRGIEVGHTFLLGDKYSKPLKAFFLTQENKPNVLQMGSYGLGLSRIIAAAVEVLSSEHEIRWPRILAPYTVVIIPPKEGSKEEPHTLQIPEKLYSLLESAHPLEDNVVLDDRKHMTIGKRLLDARRVGYPYIIVIGTRAKEDPPIFELNDIEENKQLFLNESDLLIYLNNKLK